MRMDRFTVSLPERHQELIAAEKEGADEDDLGTSEAVRRIFDRASEVDELRKQLDEVRNRRDELQNQLMATNQRIEANNELVRYVEEEKEVTSRRRRREEMKDRAGIVTKAKWTIFGMPEDAFTTDGGGEA